MCAAATLPRQCQLQGDTCYYKAHVCLAMYNCQKLRGKLPYSKVVAEVTSLGYRILTDHHEASIKPFTAKPMPVKRSRISLTLESWQQSYLALHFSIQRKDHFLWYLVIPKRSTQCRPCVCVCVCVCLCVCVCCSKYHSTRDSLLLKCFIALIRNSVSSLSTALLLYIYIYIYVCLYMHI